TEDGSPGMLNRIEVTEPPNSAPQYMLDRRTIAETGCMPNVRGSSSDTPFGAPSPGSTPTRIPSSTPMSINARCGSVIAIVNPCSKASTVSIAFSSEPEHVRQRAVRQRHLEHAFEHQVERDRRRDRDEQRARQREPVQQGQRSQHVAARGHVHAEERDRRNEHDGWSE